MIHYSLDVYSAIQSINQSIHPVFSFMNTGMPQMLFLRLARDRQTSAQSLLRLHSPRASTRVIFTGEPWVVYNILQYKTHLQHAQFTALVRD